MPETTQAIAAPTIDPAAIQALAAVIFELTIALHETNNALAASVDRRHPAAVILAISAENDRTIARAAAQIEALTR